METEEEAIQKIKEGGSRPEDWLDLIAKVQRHCAPHRVLHLFGRAVFQISAEKNRKNVSYAKLLLDYAKLQEKTSSEAARSIYQLARSNATRFAIVHVAWAQFELSQGDTGKCRRLLKKAKDYGAEPAVLLQRAFEACCEGKNKLLDDEETAPIDVFIHNRPSGSESSPEYLTNPSTDDSSTGPINSSSEGTVISFKLPSIVKNYAGVQRKCYRGGSSSSSDDTDTQPFIPPTSCGVLSKQISMSVHKPPISATPEVKAAEKSLAGNLNLSVRRRPRARRGLASCGRKIGLPQRVSITSIDDGELGGIQELEVTESGDKNKEELSSTNEELGVIKEVEVKEGKNREEMERGKCCKDPSNTRQQDKPQTQEPEQCAHGHLKTACMSCKLTALQPLQNLKQPHGGYSDAVNVERDVLPVTVHLNEELHVGIPSHGGPVNLSTGHSGQMSSHGGPVNMNASHFPHSGHMSSHGGPVNLSASHSGQMSSHGGPVNLSTSHSGQMSSHGGPVNMSASHFPHSGHMPSHGGPVNLSASHSGHMPHSGLVNLSASHSGHMPHGGPVNLSASHPGQISSHGGPVNLSASHFPHSGHMSSHGGPVNLSASHFPHSGHMSSHGGPVNFSGNLPYSGHMSSGTVVPVYPPQVHGMSLPQNTIVVNGKVYQMQGTIGKGGSSKVFRAFDGQRICAVKQVCLEYADERMVQCHINEINLLKRLQSNDNIIKVFDWELNPEKNVLLLVMECGSIDLAGYLRKNRSKITEWELRSCWTQMLQAVRVIHEEGIIHTDLKPANFLFVEGQLKLIDFGIANAIQDGHHFLAQDDKTSIERDAQVGTLNFMSPESIQDISHGSPTDPTCRNKPRMKIGRPSDVWSLGCILYAMVYGKTPFQHISNSLIKLQCIMDPTHAIDFPAVENAHLLDVMKGCLRRDPRMRYTIPQMLQHPFITRTETVVGEEQLFSFLMDFSRSAVNSPRSVRAITKALHDKLHGGRNADISSVVTSVSQRTLRPAEAPVLRKPLVDVQSLQQAQKDLKAAHVSGSSKYMGVVCASKDKENSNLESLLRQRLENKYKKALPADTPDSTFEQSWSTTAGT